MNRYYTQKIIAVGTLPRQKSSKLLCVRNIIHIWQIFHKKPRFVSIAVTDRDNGTQFLPDFALTRNIYVLSNYIFVSEQFGKF